MTLDGMTYHRIDSEADQIDMCGKRHSEEHPVDRRLIVALDMADIEAARALVSRLGDSVKYYKIGLELLFSGGLRLAQELRDEGKWIFLDMKLLDIGNTVQKAVANIAKLNFKYLTVHGLDRKTMQAAIDGRDGSKLGLLAVTVLTNLDANDLNEQGIRLSPAELVLRRAKLAHDIGFDGVIASGLEARLIRRETSSSFIIKTPGIRPAGTSTDDQSRVVTPSEAIKNGANYLVVGRPITMSSDPKRIADDINAEIRKCFNWDSRGTVA